MITAVPGVRVGHWTDRAARTGCTVVLFPGETVASGEVRGAESSPDGGTQPLVNTTIGVVATNARFDKTEMTKIAQMAHDGLARAVNPTHTMYDGDTIFALSTGTSPAPANLTAIGALAAEAVSEAILRAVMKARSIPGFPSYRDL